MYVYCQMQQLTLNKVSTVIIKLPIITTQSDVTQALSLDTNSIFGILAEQLKWRPQEKI